MKTATCCERHAAELPCGCNQGRACPERTRRVQEAELRRGAIGYEAGTYYAELDEPPVTQESAFAWLSPGFKLAMVLLAAVACATYFVLRYPRLPLWAVANYFMGAV